MSERWRLFLGKLAQAAGLLFLGCGLLLAFALIGGCVALPLILIGFPTLTWGRLQTAEARRARQQARRRSREALSP